MLEKKWTLYSVMICCVSAYVCVHVRGFKEILSLLTLLNNFLSSEFMIIEEMEE